MSQTQVTRLMRIAWETVGGILARVVADKLDRGRLDGLVQIGVDEVSSGADHKFLTCVADHVAGRSCGRPRGATPPACRHSSTGSRPSRRRRSPRSRSTCPPGMRKRSAHRLASRTPRSCSTPSTSSNSAAGRSTRSAATSTTATGARAAARAKLQPAQGSRQPDHQAAAQARRGTADQQAHVPRVPAPRRAALHLPALDP